MPAQRKQFQPSSRGDLSMALKNRKSLAIVAPQSPRPPEMLAGISVVKGAEQLTSSDLALHELLISKAYETDISMSRSSYEIPLAECLRFLWSDAREADVRASLTRMERVRLSFAGEEGRSFRNVQMLTAWSAEKGAKIDIGYQFPDPIKWLMRTMPSYGYVELAAIGHGAMRSRYSALLYKRLVHEVSLRRWREGSDNCFVLEFTPAELAALVGYIAPAGSFFSKLQERVISKFERDFLGVRKFDLRITYDGLPSPARGQGRKTSLIQLHVKIHPDTHHMVRADDRTLRVWGDQAGKADIPRYRINSVFWLQVAQKFRSLSLTHHSAYWAWSVALDEALEGVPLTAGHGQRRYRGKNLLAAIDANGVEAAAWCFFAEEVEIGADLCNSPHVIQKLGQADKSRLERIAGKKRKPKSRPAVEGKGAAAAAPRVVERPVEPSFETCTHIDLEIDHAASAADLDGFVYEPLSQLVWNGDHERRLRVYFRAPGTTARQHFGFKISPDDEGELLAALRKLDTWLTGPPIYRIEHEDARS